ncbi:AAA family ATPase [Roseococcus sp. DSY-14]|uniref:AAA family ATPase n=1 Tax=Roseococcus sp. DSY-14 TaxID=3369650 RepID=UPI00387B1C44
MDALPEQILEAAGATTEAFEPPRGKGFGRLRLLAADDAVVAPPRSYLLKGLMAPRELSVWWGQPKKAAKSFLLLSLAYRLSQGRGMWGLRARPCRVIYAAAEGEAGLAARITALRMELGPAPAFRYIAQRFQVGPPSADLESLKAAILDHRADLIVLDTLARTFGEGNEDATQDMGRFVAAADTIREDCRCHVAIVHHGPKDAEAKAPRGSVALVGAADVVVKVAPSGGEGIRTATVELAKDEADGASYPFRLREVEIGRDEEGDPRVTCIAEEADAPGRQKRTVPQAKAGWLQDLREAFAEPDLPVLRVPLQGMKPTLTLTRDQLRSHWRVRVRLDADTHATLTDAQRRRLSENLNWLKDQGFIGMTPDLVWLV